MKHMANKGAMPGRARLYKWNGLTPVIFNTVRA